MASSTQTPVVLPDFSAASSDDPPEGAAASPTSLQPTYVDPSEPTTSGDPDAFTSVYAPSFYKGLIDAATFLVDVPTMGAGYVMGAGAEALGFDESAKRFRNPVLLSDVVKGGFEAPARIGEAITGEAPGAWTAGFDATPREARTQKEKFFRDAFYISGGALSFPTALGAAFGTFRAPVQKLLSEAGGRSVNSEAARKAIDFASNAKGPNAPQALVEAARG